MKIAILKERRPAETRVAASPDTVRKLIALGAEVTIETGAGAAAAMSDDAYRSAGAAIAETPQAALAGAELVLKVQRPLAAGEGALDELALIPRGAALVGLLAPYAGDHVKRYAEAGLTSFSMELLPRITRAQSMDVLSSQANLAGYKAVLDAAGAFGRAFPMMMTAAGTIPPARVLVMGAGVAGLQAIATARRLGAIVSATDVRYAAKEQVESLGASFLAVDLEAMKAMETAGGYAREMGEDFARRQREFVTEALKKIDIVILTALVPGRKAPVLLTAEMVAALKPGSVIVDLAVEQGGNCALSTPGETTVAHGVTILGYSNVPGRLATDASALYARNLLAFVTPMIEKGATALKIDTGDEIIKATLLTRDGEIVHSAFAPPEARLTVAATDAPNVSAADAPGASTADAPAADAPAADAPGPVATPPIAPSA